MDVHFSAEQESLISQVALHHGTTSTQVVQNAVLRVLAEEERFGEAVREGVEAADRGMFVENDQLWSDLEAILAEK